MLRPTALVLFLALLFTLVPKPVEAQEGWLVKSMDATYTVRADASVEVLEDILVDFGTVERRGIDRSIQVEFAYVPSPSERLDPASTYQLVYELEVLAIDDGARPLTFTTFRDDQDLVIQIGDPDAPVSGENRYRIRYVVQGAYTSVARWDEFWWNATGTDWEVSIERAKATVKARAIIGASCNEGPAGASGTNCVRGFSQESAIFRNWEPLEPGSSLVFGVATAREAVNVPPPNIVSVVTASAENSDALIEFTPWRIMGVALLAFAAVLALLAFRALRRRRR